MKILKSKKLITVLAMLLMVATVVGMGTMTYSRYVTQAGMTAPEQATVADWGYVLTINSQNLFGKQYEGNVINESFAATEDDKIDVMVVGEAKGKIIAPGTSGSMTITVSGNAEVLAQLAITVADTSKDVALVYKESDAGAVKTYNPIKWTLTKKVGEDDAEPVGTANTTLANIVSSLQGQGGKIEAGTTIETTVYTLSWAWDINESTAADNATNKMDTALGMKAAGKTDTEIKTATGLILATDAEGNATNLILSVQISASIIQIQD